MSVTWADLTKTQRRLLIRVGDPNLRESEDGVEVSRIAPQLLLEAAGLVEKRLVKRTEGHSGRVWLRLTEAGRQVEEGGN